MRPLSHAIASKPRFWRRFAKIAGSTSVPLIGAGRLAGSGTGTDGDQACDQDAGGGEMINRRAILIAHPEGTVRIETRRGAQSRCGPPSRSNARSARCWPRAAFRRPGWPTRVASGEHHLHVHRQRFTLVIDDGTIKHVFYSAFRDRSTTEKIASLPRVGRPFMARNGCDARRSETANSGGCSVAGGLAIYGAAAARGTSHDLSPGTKQVANESSCLALV